MFLACKLFIIIVSIFGAGFVIKYLLVIYIVQILLAYFHPIIVLFMAFGHEKL